MSDSQKNILLFLVTALLVLVLLYMAGAIRHAEQEPEAGTEHSEIDHAHTIIAQIMRGELTDEQRVRIEAGLLQDLRNEYGVHR